MQMLAAACSASLGSPALAQSLNHLAAETSESSAAVNIRASVSGDESGLPASEAEVHWSASANPRRQAMATSALLTPAEYAQFESGLLYATGSAQFSHRFAEEQTMRLDHTNLLGGALCRGARKIARLRGVAGSLLHRCR
jgi:hypothetical protein